MTANVEKIYTVRDLRRALKGLPDSREVMFQVIETGGQAAWLMHGHMVPDLDMGDRPVTLLQLWHPDLKELPLLDSDEREREQSELIDTIVNETHTSEE